MLNGKLVGSLDIIIRMLDDSEWSQKAKSVKSMGEFRRILVDFCNAKGEVVQIDKDTLWLHVGTRMKGNTGA
jgi:hypothetical protein